MTGELKPSDQRFDQFETHFSTVCRLSPRHNTPCANLVVGIARKQSLTIGTPGQTDTVWFLGFLALLNVIRLQLVNLALLLEIENGNGGSGGSAKPVSIGREDEGVDFVTGLEGVEVFRLVEIPQHRGTILATRGAERSIGRNGDGVDVASVADVVGLNAARSKFPDLSNVRRGQTRSESKP
jgi:hypothetical protein